MNYPTRSDSAMAARRSPVTSERALIPLPLTDDSDEREVLAFLAERPAHTVVLGGYIRDNGFESPFNPGAFYACRDERGRMRGVALVGDEMHVEARDDAALRAFANLACKCRAVRTLTGEQMVLARMRRLCSAWGRRPRVIGRRLLFVRSGKMRDFERVSGLRHATHDDLRQLLPVNAAISFASSGVNPLESDLRGFRLRAARGVEQGRTWVLFEEGRLIFKADVSAETVECARVAGLYVNPAVRRRGYGSRCLAHLSAQLLETTGAVSVLADEEDAAARSLLTGAGYKPRGRIDTIAV